MPWFKVDDGFATSEPVMRIPRRYRASVIGLWTLSGTWCAKELTDGRVPSHMLDELGCTVAQARMLVEAGLWSNTPTGYVFIGWSKYQPTREKVEAERKKEADRKAAYRLSRGDTAGTPPGVPLVSQPESGHPDPTRPDPTNKKDLVHASHARQIALDFDEWWSVFPRKEGKEAARRRYEKVRKSVAAEPLLEGVRAYALLKAGEDKQFVKMPAGWLNDGRWSDDHTAAVVKPTVSGTVTPAACPTHGYPLPCKYADEGGCF